MRLTRRGIATVTTALGAALTTVLLLVTAAAGAPAVPANDTVSGAQVIRSFPATIGGTLVGASTEVGEPQSSCEVASASSVWYSLRSASAQRIAINLAASGTLDATIDVYHAVRSQNVSAGCERTDAKGKASLSFNASKNGLYLIRVAAQQNSQLAPFSLQVFLPTPAIRPPGAPLPAGGISGQVDPVQNINAAYAFTMRAGVSYLINLTAGRREGCIDGALFAPGTHSFDEGSAAAHIGCHGYRLFTPHAGQGGRYSFEISPRERGVQRFHLQVAAAGPAETAPGIALGNYGQAHGRLDGGGVSVLRLYRMDVTSHSNLTLRLKAPPSADFNLQLRNLNGRVIECRCGDSGAQRLAHQLDPGRYYAVVSVRDNSSGNFTLVRESRTITSTSLSFTSSKASAGRALGIDVKVSPAASGPVTVDIERFDPVFGWQFYRESHASASGGSASVPFVPPAVGRWRAKAAYGGSRTASPSAVGFSYLLVS